MRYLGGVLIVLLLLGIGFESGLSTLTSESAAANSQTGSDAVGPLRLLTIYKAGPGSGTVYGAGILCGADCNQYYSSGAVVNLTAKPAAGSKFNGWSGCSYSTNPKISVTMVSNKTCTAKFK